MKPQTSQEQKQSSERDFEKEYNDLLLLMGRTLDAMKFEWKKDGDHIKKFSLLKDSPTPILTNHIITE